MELIEIGEVALNPNRDQTETLTAGGRLYDNICSCPKIESLVRTSNLAKHTMCALPQAQIDFGSLVATVRWPALKEQSST